MSLVFICMDRTSFSTLRLGSRFMMFCRLYTIWLLTGAFPSMTLPKYSLISTSLVARLSSPLSFCLMLTARVLVEGSLISRSKCSTPTSSASSAPMLQGMCLKTRCISSPCPWTSSTDSYAVVGRPSTPGRTSIMINTGSFAQNLRNIEAIFKSFSFSFGPEL